MAYYVRILQQTMERDIRPGKVLLLYGSRRVGKTVLVKQIAQNFKGTVQMMNGEDYDTVRLLEERTVANYRRLFSSTGLLILDEAHQISDIGRKLKLMVDEIPHLCIIASGSSAFHLLNQTMEPLTGRCRHFPMFPLSQTEFSRYETLLETRRNLEDRLIFGCYPEIASIEDTNEKRRYLTDLTHSFLFKDVLSLEGIRNSSKITDLLRLVAFQTGKEVSGEELGRQLGLSRNTVEKYLAMLSSIFLIFKLTGFRRNLRKEISRNNKWYFYDNGVRNVLTGNFQPLALRTDNGELWENYLLSERIKRSSYLEDGTRFFFWRTYDQQEIDVIESCGDELKAFEIKWKAKKTRIPAAWQQAYPNATWEVLTRENYLDWIV